MPVNNMQISWRADTTAAATSKKNSNRHFNKQFQASWLVPSHCCRFGLLLGFFLRCLCPQIFERDLPYLMNSQRFNFSISREIQIPNLNVSEQSKAAIFLSLETFGPVIRCHVLRILIILSFVNSTSSIWETTHPCDLNSREDSSFSIYLFEINCNLNCFEEFQSLTIVFSSSFGFANFTCVSAQLSVSL